MKKILIFGATSSIAEHTARNYAQQGAEFFLVARNKDRLETLAKDLEVRGAKKTDCLVMDACDFDKQNHRRIPQC